MAAATEAIDTPARAGEYLNIPVAASAVIYQGSLVAVDASGNANPAADTAGLTVVGRAEETVDNSSGLAGALSVRVQRGTFRFANSATDAVDADDLYDFAYVEDDTTVNETGGSNTVRAGIVVEVSTDYVWIDTRFNKISAATIDPGAVDSDELADDAVTTAKIADDAVTPDKSLNVQARTATADGLTTAIISDTARHVTVTSGNADHIIVLPTPTPGRQVVIDVGANGCELRSSAPATVAINGGTGSNAESAIAANSTIVAICVSATAWKAFFMDADGDVAKVEAAA